MQPPHGRHARAFGFSASVVSHAIERKDFQGKLPHITLHIDEVLQSQQRAGFDEKLKRKNEERKLRAEQERAARNRHWHPEEPQHK